MWRWGFTLDGIALWLGLPLVLAETYGFVMLAAPGVLVLAHDRAGRRRRPWRAAAWRC